jgi:glycosyltransferase involved in cell wall biosynthesis
MKIAFVTTDWAQSDYRKVTGEMGAVGYYRCYKPAEYLEKLGYETHVFGSKEMMGLSGDSAFDGFGELIKDYDLVIIKQLDNRHCPKLIAACKQRNIPMIMDLDDNFLAIDKDHPSDGYEIGGIKRAYATAALSMMDGLFVSTEPLKKYYKNFLKKQFDIDMPTWVLPNSCDPKEWNFKTETNGDKIAISYHGSITHDNDLKLILGHIHDIMKENKDVYFLIFGAIRQTSQEELFGDWDDEVKERLAVIPGTPSFNSFPEMLCNWKLDIGIAPLEDTEFTRGKSHIKWMEYALRETPTVASKVYPYYKPVNGLETISDGDTGMLARNHKQFKEKLLKLIEDKELRKEMGKNAKKYVLDNWQYKDTVKFWDEAIKEFMKTR